MKSSVNGSGIADRSIITTALVAFLLIILSSAAALALCSGFKSNEDPLLFLKSNNSTTNGISNHLSEHDSIIPIHSLIRIHTSDVVSRILTAADNSTNNDFFNHPSDHDSLIPIQASDVVGFLCAALGLIIAAGGGIGGGGILVPIYILILGFMPKHAIPLSNVTVFGGAIANTLRNSRKRHPAADRPLIDWDLIVVMEPPTLAGALIGANLNKMLPETVIASLLVILLAFTAYSTLRKAWRMYQQETADIKRHNVGTRTVEVDSTTMIPDSKFDSDGGNNEYLLLNDSASDEEEVDFLENHNLTGLSLHDIDNIHHPPTLRHCGLSSLSSIQLDDDASDDVGDDSVNEDLLEFGDPLSIDIILEQEKHPRRRNVVLIVAMFFIVLIINILKGGGGFQSPFGIECGSAAFWVAQGLLLVWILFVSWLGRRLLLKDTARKIEAGCMYLDDDLKWDRKSTVIYPLISTLAGFCAGMFGIGGGIIKGPLMLAMGVHPAVASATSACMILFTSFTATTTFSVYGLMVPDYAIAGAVLGFCATFLGQTIMSRILAKSKRNSYIAFSIGFVVLLSAVLMTLESVLHLVSEEENDEFGGICDAHLNGHNS